MRTFYTTFKKQSFAKEDKENYPVRVLEATKKLGNAKKKNDVNVDEEKKRGLRRVVLHPTHKHRHCVLWMITRWADLHETSSICN